MWGTHDDNSDDRRRRRAAHAQRRAASLHRSCGICKDVLRELEAVCRESRGQRARIVFLRHDLQVPAGARGCGRAGAAAAAADRPRPA